MDLRRPKEMSTAFFMEDRLQRQGLRVSRKKGSAWIANSADLVRTLPSNIRVVLKRDSMAKGVRGVDQQIGASGYMGGKSD